MSGSSDDMTCGSPSSCRRPRRWQ